MSQRKATLAINNIKKSVVCLRQYKPSIFNVSLEKLGVMKVVRNHCYDAGIKTLNDLDSALEILPYVYSEDGDRLISLSRQIRSICKKYLSFDVNKANVDLVNEIVISTQGNKKAPTTKKAVKTKKKTKPTATKKTVTSSFLKKFHNFYRAKTFTEDYFLKMGDWGGTIPGSKHHKIIKVTLKDGFVFNAYSEEERAFIRKLEKEKQIRIIRGGNYGIEIWSGDELSYTYYPDAFIQTKDGKIGIIEIKPLYDLCDSMVQEKWEMLKQLCEEKGYMCFIGNRAFNGYKELKERPCPKALEDAVRIELRNTDEFNYEDYREYKKTSTLKGRPLDVALSALCIRKHYTFEINYYGVRQFRITKDW